MISPQLAAATAGDMHSCLFSFGAAQLIVSVYSEALEDLVGGVSLTIFTSDILDRDLFWNQELLKTNDVALFSCFTGIFGGSGERKGIQELHEYSILRSVEIDQQRLLLLRYVSPPSFPPPKRNTTHVSEGPD